MITWKDIKKIAVLKLSKEFKGKREYLDRLRYEFEQIGLQGAGDYWADVYEKKQKTEANPNGLLLPFLLGLTDVDPIREEIKPNIQYHPDYPDIDIDFLPIARAPVKKYAAEKYGHNGRR